MPPENIDWAVIWMSLVVFLPSAFALVLLFFPKGQDEAMRWWALLGTAATLGVSFGLFFQFKNDVIDFRGVNTNPVEARKVRESASLEGRAAEMEILGTMTAGAADDIERAATLARRMVAELGMSDLGPICVKEGHAPPSSALLDRVEETSRQLLEAQLGRARAIVRERRAGIDRLVTALLERDTLGAEEIRGCFEEMAEG